MLRSSPRRRNGIHQLAVSERNAEHDLSDERACAVVVLFDRVHNALDGAMIAILQTAPERVPQDLAGNLPQKLILMLQQHLPQLDRPRELRQVLLKHKDEFL